MKFILFMLAMLLTSCSANQQQTQARILDVTGRVANVSLDVWIAEYRRQLTETADLACGNVTPCPESERAEAQEAVDRVAGQWNPVFLAWASLQTAHAAYSTQVEACRLVDAGCAVNFVLITTEILQHQNEFRCALRRLNVTDPFPGELNCNASTVHDAGVDQ